MILELRSPQDVAAADDHGDLAARPAGLLDFPGDVDDFLHADPSLSGTREAVPGKLEYDAAKRLQRGAGGLLGHRA